MFLTAAAALGQVLPINYEWWTPPSSLQPQPTEAERDMGRAAYLAGQDKIWEAADAMMSAITHDPMAKNAWRTFRQVRANGQWRSMNFRAVRRYPAFGAVLTCGYPEEWPRFAVIGCGTSYMRFAEELDGDGRTADASRYREVVGISVTGHALTALDGHANDCAQAFLSLSDSILPFSKRDREGQIAAYSISAYVEHNLGNYLLAIDTLEKLAELNEFTADDRKILRSTVIAIERNVSWIQETGLLRAFDPDDFFDSDTARYEREHSPQPLAVRDTGKPIPYGMTSVDEDIATIFEVWSCKCSKLDDTVTDRIKKKNFELPVKVALHYAWLLVPRNVSDVDYEPDFRKLLSLIEKLSVGVKGDGDIPEPTLLGFEIARRVAAILARVNRPNPDDMRSVTRNLNEH